MDYINTQKSLNCFVFFVTISITILMYIIQSFSSQMICRYAFFIWDIVSFIIHESWCTTNMVLTRDALGQFYTGSFSISVEISWYQTGRDVISLKRGKLSQRRFPSKSQRSWWGCSLLLPRRVNMWGGPPATSSVPVCYVFEVHIPPTLVDTVFASSGTPRYQLLSRPRRCIHFSAWVSFWLLAWIHPYHPAWLFRFVHACVARPGHCLISPFPVALSNISLCIYLFICSFLGCRIDSDIAPLCVTWPRSA
jgi:hypothetical protein